MVLLLYAIYISVFVAHHELFHATVGKGGIMHATHWPGDLCLLK